jgi:proton glutamate symport protein
MDMARTMVNLVGNCLATAVMARWEGVMGTETPAGSVSLAAAVAPARSEA